jgi:hypothetical protein
MNEEFNLQKTGYRSKFIAQTGEISDKNNLDKIKEYLVKEHSEQIHKGRNFHRFINTYPLNFQHLIYNAKYDDAIISILEKSFTSSHKISTFNDIDEVYISKFNIDNGGDQQMFKPHLDGNLKYLSDFTMIRVLVYLISDDDYIVHFIDSDKHVNFKSGEFGLWDFHREKHYVSRENENNNIENHIRLILKLHYVIRDDCRSEVENNIFCYLTKLFSFDIARTAMNYSQNPQSIYEKIIGKCCNIVSLCNYYMNM